MTRREYMAEVERVVSATPGSPEVGPLLEGADWLLEEVRRLRGALAQLRHGSPPCWCGMATGNPMVNDHSPACRFAQLVTDDLEVVR